ncbi:MAG: rRNA pseudouridine synthase [Ruminococcaceae bacterium]|nr:rRNA pseudouridine synthase [Oscillospiraceae bacterium]
MRLQKYMAECGVASRRKCEEIINQGRVKVNGTVVTAQGVQIDPETDAIEVDGQMIAVQEQKIYIMLNKPKGVITSVSDQFGRKSVLDLIDCPYRLFPVGRLDYDTEGLLLLTNDGEFAYRMTHPGHMVEKCYVAKVKGIPNQAALERLRFGVEIEGKKTAPAKAEWENEAVVLTIHEGRNRQVRKMLETVGHPVQELKRVSVGNLLLGNLPVGQWRYLNQNELELLR